MTYTNADPICVSGLRYNNLEWPTLVALGSNITIKYKASAGWCAACDEDGDGQCTPGCECNCVRHMYVKLVAAESWVGGACAYWVSSRSHGECATVDLACNMDPALNFYGQRTATFDAPTSTGLYHVKTRAHLNYCSWSEVRTSSLIPSTRRAITL